MRVLRACTRLETVNIAPGTPFCDSRAAGKHFRKAMLGAWTEARQPDAPVSEYLLSCLFGLRSLPGALRSTNFGGTLRNLDVGEVPWQFFKIFKDPAVRRVFSVMESLSSLAVSIGSRSYWDNMDQLSSSEVYLDEHEGVARWEEERVKREVDHRFTDFLTISPKVLPAYSRWLRDCSS